MNTSILNKLSKLQAVRSSEHFEHLIPFVESNVNPAHHNQFLNIYAAYIFVVEYEPETFSGLRILNDSQSLSRHVRTFIGLIYLETDFTLRKTPYDLAKYTNKIFTSLATTLKLSFRKVDIKADKISDDVQKCIELYRNLNLNHEKLDYLNGWSIKSKEGQSQQVNLDSIYCQYGTEFTKTILNALQCFGLKKNHRH